MSEQNAGDNMVRLVLTPEQREVVRRMSGQHIEALELAPDPEDTSAGTGGALRFRWRLSAATGIPRQAWAKDEPPTS